MKSLVVANWKMNPSSWREAKALFEATKKAAEKMKRTSIVVAPPAIYLRDLKALCRGRSLSFAIQHAHFEKGGAYTGEISLAQAREAGASYVIVGHSERRALGESNDDTRRKVAAALSFKLAPVLCVGELSRASDGEYLGVVREQVRAGLSDVAPEKVGGVILAYEPVWAIGGEEAVNPSAVHEMAVFIRKTAVGAKGQRGMRIKILYGGSANEENAALMLKDGDVAGLLVGHVSVDAARFAGLLKSLA